MSSSVSVALKMTPDLSGVAELMEKQLKIKLKKSGFAGGKELGDAIVKGARQVLGQGLTGLEADVQRFGGRVEGRVESSLGSSGETADKKMGEVAGNVAGRALEAGLPRAAPELGALGARLGQNLSKESGKLGAEAGREFAQKVVSVSVSLVNRGFTASTGALRDFVTGFREGETAGSSLGSRIGRMGIAMTSRSGSALLSAEETDSHEEVLGRLRNESLIAGLRTESRCQLVSPREPGESI